MNYYRVVTAYLDKQSRLPALPDNLLNSIHTWLSPYYTRSIAKYFSGKPTSTVSKTFKVNDPRIINVKTLKVKFIPKQFKFHALYNPNYNTIIVGIPAYLTKQTLESPEELSYDLKTYLQHELIHFLQLNTEHNIGGKIQDTEYRSGQQYNQDYGQEYFRYSEEIKPNLVNAVDRFKYIYKNNFDADDIRNFVDSSDFFTALKVDTKLFNSTVKDFYLLIASD